MFEVVEHDLKCWPAPFQDAKAGLKTFEIRKNDRNYQPLHILRLREFIPCGRCRGQGVEDDWDNFQVVGVKVCCGCAGRKGVYTGEEIRRQVTYILPGGQFGLASDYVCMSIVPWHGVEV